MTASTTEDFSREEVEATLAAILADDRFANAPQMSAFLAYVVRQTLDGEADRIKAYTVGVDALGKPETFDPQNDPSVRVLAKRLRTFLDAYNARHPEQPLVIELRPGSYKPLFLRPSSDEPVASSGARTAAASFVRGASSAPPPSSASAASATAEATLASERVPDGGEPAREAKAADATADATTFTVTPVGLRVTAPLQASGGAMSSAPLASAAIPPWMRRGERSALLATLGVGAVAVVATLSLARGPATDEQPLLGAASGALDGATVALLPRPQAPVLQIDRYGAAPGSLEARLATLLSSAMVDAEELTIVRSPAMSPNGAVWPEQYELSLQSVRVGSRLRLETQLLHGTDGRLVHADSIGIETDEEGTLSPAALAALDTLATRLAAEDGPLLSDYRRYVAALETAESGF